MLNPVSIRADFATGSYSAIYNSVYGTIEVGLEMFEDRYAISKLKIVQNKNDVYTGLSGTNRLSDIHKSILGDTPNGLISVESGLKISRQNNTGKPFSTIVSYNIYKSHESSWSSDRTLSLTEYRKIHNSDEITALHLPIPDGQSVQSLDPAYKSLALAYRGGEVVRQVDGKSLDEVIASDQRRGRLTKIGLIVLAGVVLLACIGLVIRWRVKRRAGKVVAP